MHDAKLIISMLEFSSDPSFEQTVGRFAYPLLPFSHHLLTLLSKVDWEAFAQANGYKHAASGRNQYAKAKARLGLVGKKTPGASTTPKKASGVTKKRSNAKGKPVKSLDGSDDEPPASLENKLSIKNEE